MNIIELFEVFESTINIVNYTHFNRYKKLILFYHDKKLIKIRNENLYESHHVLPRKLFPEFIKNKSNIVVLPLKAHFLAHYFLYKCTKLPSTIFAFNQMRRIANNGKHSSRLYEKARIYISDVIRETNSNKERSDYHIKILSEVNKNKNTYKHINTGELIRCIIGEEPIDYIPFQCGRKYSDITKEKHSFNNKNKVWAYCEETKEVIFSHIIPDNFVKGYAPWLYSNYNENIKDTIWIYNATTNEHKRIHKNDNILTGYEIGRNRDITSIGLSCINKSGMKKVLDLVDKRYKMVLESEIHELRYVKYGSAVDNFILYEYNNIIYRTFLEMFYALGWIPKGIRRNELILDVIIPVPHYKHSVIATDFYLKNHGKSLREVGLSIIKLIDFDFYKNMDKIYVKCG